MVPQRPQPRAVLELVQELVHSYVLPNMEGCAVVLALRVLQVRHAYLHPQLAVGSSLCVRRPRDYVQLPFRAEVVVITPAQLQTVPRAVYIPLRQDQQLAYPGRRPMVVSQQEQGQV